MYYQMIAVLARIAERKQANEIEGRLDGSRLHYTTVYTQQIKTSFLWNKSPFDRWEKYA